MKCLELNLNALTRFITSLLLLLLLLIMMMLLLFLLYSTCIFSVDVPIAVIASIVVVARDGNLNIEIPCLQFLLNIK